MLPHEHFVVAFVPVVLYVLLRYRRLPSRGIVAAVGIGSLFPDLVDKPLAHYLFVLPSGRVFAHSLPVAIPLAIGVLVYGWQTDRFQLAGAFTTGFLLHPYGDFYGTLVSGAVPPHLFWPLVSVSPTPHTPAWAVPWTAFSVVVLAGVFLVLLRDVQLQLRRQGPPAATPPT